MKFLAARQSVLIALTLTLTLAGWLLTGQFQNSEAALPVTKPVVERKPTMNVRVRQFKAQMIEQEISFTGHTQAARAVTLRAEVIGRVTALSAERGAYVNTGDVIARLDNRDREAKLQQVQALLKQRELEYEGFRKLTQRGHQSETLLAQAQAALENARAQLKRVQLEIENTVVRAPFAGVLDQLTVEIGDYLSIGDPLARILEVNPLIIEGAVSQYDVQQLHKGMPGTAQLVTGQNVNGVVRFVATESDSATRTFQVELEIDNTQHDLAAGLTAEIRIPTLTVDAHHLSPALLALGENGEIGIKTVADNNQVMFFPARIIRADAAGMWVTGLPENVRVITIGQGFVRHGQTVNAVSEAEKIAGGLEAKKTL